MDIGGILSKIKWLEEKIIELTKKQGGGGGIGLVLPYAGATAPTGFLLCNGASLLRAGTYANLFAVIGTTYGSADGTHFNLPNLAGRVPVGKSADTEFDVLGETGGEKTHTLTSSESGLKDHTHNIGVENTGGYVPNGIGINAFLFGSFGNGDTRNGYPTDRLVTSVRSSGIVQGVAGGASNASSAHNNLQPYITLNYIIRY